jgi:hypothetical protein
MTADQVWTAVIAAGFVALVVLGVYMSRTQAAFARRMNAEALCWRATTHSLLMTIEHRGGDHYRRRGLRCPLCPASADEGHDAIIVPAPLAAPPRLVRLTCSCGKYRPEPAPEGEALTAWMEHVTASTCNEVTS